MLVYVPAEGKDGSGLLHGLGSKRRHGGSAAVRYSQRRFTSVNGYRLTGISWVTASWTGVMTRSKTYRLQSWRPEVVILHSRVSLPVTGLSGSCEIRTICWCKGVHPLCSPQGIFPLGSEGSQSRLASIAPKLCGFEFETNHYNYNST